MSEQDRRARRLEQRRTQQRRRLLLVVVLAAVAGVLAALVAGGGSGRNSPARATGTARAASAANAITAAGRTPDAAGVTASTPGSASPPRTSASAPPPSHEHHQPRAARSPGSLPQTRAFPSASSAAFNARMAALWAGVVSGSLGRAESAFFPERAYVQVKAIAAAEDDWRNRLLRDYVLDLDAAHALLGADAAHARLVAVRTDSSYGHWVPPGVCYNAVGYYEMPGARVVYREGRAVRSFGIASMISWRGEWYVVHLGAVLREGDGGVVDEPQSGPGTPAYSGTC
jgi:hypothetical protein